MMVCALALLDLPAAVVAQMHGGGEGQQHMMGQAST
jgi:hypothetical protein